ncbi:MAG: helix-turn-helix domain-containing protein [Bacteroidales bacterium]|nr:helix-turn-helix domain-containing protein [Bacteroidales bacterium]
MNGYRIAEERKKLGLTQRQLAEKLKVSQKSISKYERDDRRPSYETLLEMSILFGVSVDYLVGTGAPPVPSAPAAQALTDEEAELLRYYRSLDRLDQRWIMGQIVDLLRRKEDETPMVVLKRGAVISIGEYREKRDKKR